MTQPDPLARPPQPPSAPITEGRLPPAPPGDQPGYAPQPQQPGYQPGWGPAYGPAYGPGWGPRRRGFGQLNNAFPLRPALPWVTLGIGLVFLVLAVVIPLATVATTHAHQAYADGTTTSGTVQSVHDDVTYSTGNRGTQTRHDSYTAVIAFTTAGGRDVTFTDTRESGTPYTGEQVTVSYRDADPADARWVQPSEIGVGVVFGIVAGVVALGLLATSAVLLVRRRRRTYA